MLIKFVKISCLLYALRKIIKIHSTDRVMDNQSFVGVLGIYKKNGTKSLESLTQITHLEFYLGIIFCLSENFISFSIRA